MLDEGTLDGQDADHERLAPEHLRHMLELAGRREAAMMLPVVFLILPVIVLVAVYPGLVAFHIW